jgi:hypothetical protein
MTTDSGVQAARSRASAARFTRRVTFAEDPDVVDQLEELAEGWGRSLAGEVRAAVRYWIETNAR